LPKPFVIKLIIKPCFKHHCQSFLWPIVATVVDFDLILFANFEVVKHSYVGFTVPFIIAKEQLLDFKLKVLLELELGFVVKAYFCQHFDLMNTKYLKDSFDYLWPFITQPKRLSTAVALSWQAVLFFSWLHPSPFVFASSC